MSNIYVLTIGQSNAVGSGEPDVYTTALSNRCKAWDANTSGILAPISDPQSQYQKVTDVDYFVDDTGHTHASFVPDILNVITTEFVSDDVISVMCAKGSTDIADWLRNESNHTDVTTLYGNAIAKLADAGYTNEELYIVWNQGESDKNSDIRDYQIALQNLYENLLEDLSDNTKFCVVNTGDAILPNVKLAQIRVTDLSTNTKAYLVATASDLETITGSTSHYKNTSYFTLGQRIGDAIVKIKNGTNDYRNPVISSVTNDPSDENNVLVTFTLNNGTALATTGELTSFKFYDIHGIENVPSSILKINDTQVKAVFAAKVDVPTVRTYTEARNDLTNILYDNGTIPRPMGVADVTEVQSMSVDFTDFKMFLAPNSHGKGNGTSNSETGNVPSRDGLYQNVVRNNMTGGFGYLYNSGDASEKFNGTTSNLSTNRTIDFTDASNQTMMFRYRNLGGSGFRALICRHTDANNFYYLAIDGSNRIIFVVKVGGVQRTVLSSTTVGVKGTIVLVKEGTTKLNLYLDGIEVAYTTHHTYNIGSSSFSTAEIGVFSSMSYLNGEMLYVADAERAITDTEVLNYEALGDDLGLIGNNVGDDLTLTAPPAPGYVSQNKMDIGIGIGI